MNFRIIVLLVFLLSFPVFVYAAESPSSLQVEPIYPANQVPETKGYFDLTVKPNEKATMHLRLGNPTSAPITVRVEKSNAYTSPTGGIFYEQEIDSEDTELLNDIAHMVNYMEAEETVTVPANETIDLPIQVTVPQTDAQTLLGGIQVTQVEKTDEESQEIGDEETNFVVNTETTYAIAIQLNLPTSSEPNFSTGKAGFIAPTAQVFLEVINDAYLIQGDIDWAYSVLDNTGTELFNGAVNTFNMAPKSKIRFPIAWNHEDLADGSYTLVADGHAGDQVISVEESFEISNEEVEEYSYTINPNPDADEEEGVSMWIWIVAAAMFGIIMFFAGRRKKS